MRPHMNSNPKLKLIPKGTIAKVRMHIKPGGYDHIKQERADNGYATRHSTMSPVHLSVSFTVLTGEYSGRQMFGTIGLHSDVDKYYKRMGYVLVRGILCSAHGISIYDKS